MDCGPTCLRMIAKFYGRIYSADLLRERAFITRDGVSLGGIAEAAESIGFQTLAISVDFESLKTEIPLPCIVYWRQRHFVVVYKIKRDRVYVADPAFGLVDYSISEFCHGWLNTNKSSENTEGVVLVLETTPTFYQVEEEKQKASPGFSLLVPYFRPYRKLILHMVLGLVVLSLIQLAFPFLTQSLVDYGVAFQQRNFIYLILAAQLILFVSETGIQLVRDWILLHITSRVNVRLLSNFLIKLFKLSLSFFDSKNIGDLLQRIQQDHTRIQLLLSSNTLSIAFSMVEVLIFGGILAYHDLFIYFVFFLGSAFYIGWTLLFMKKRAVLDHIRFDLSSDNQSNLIQLIDGLQEIKLNGSDRRRRWEWEAIQTRVFRTSISALSLDQTLHTGGAFINQLKNLIITFLAAEAVVEGKLTLGVMLAIQYIVGALNVPITNFIHFLEAFQDAKLSLERISEVYQRENEDQDDKHYVTELPRDESIYLKDVSFRYGSSASPLIIKDFSLSIPAGKVTAIVGASGSGKTTLLKLLLKFYEVTEGKISVGNTNINSFNAAFWRHHCGSVMQDGFIFGDTIARNITESATDGMIDKDRLLSAVRLANLEEFIDSLPLGFKTKIGASGISISGGQKQRILIARAVYKNPKYLFFDEATSALDANNERIIQDNMERFFEKKTVVIIAHRLSTVKKADNIVVLERGEQVEQGTHQELIDKKGAYFTLVKNQLELGE